MILKAIICAVVACFIILLAQRGKTANASYFTMFILFLAFLVFFTIV